MNELYIHYDNYNTNIKHLYIHIYNNLFNHNKYIYNIYVITTNKNLWLNSEIKHKEWVDNNKILKELKNIISYYEFEEYINNL